MLDTGRLRASFEHIAPQAPDFARWFYAHLFLHHPGLRGMFPVSMEDQDRHLIGALAQVVDAVDDPARLTPLVQQLGRDHRKFAVVAEHFEAVGASILAALEYFLAEAWTPEVKAAWAEAYGAIAGLMKDAMAADEETWPAWWDGEVVAAEKRSYDVAVLTVATHARLPYQPGQSVAIEVPAAAPRVWRYYSPASAPREDTLLEFHIRATGPVSSALAAPAARGLQLRLGPPVGTLVHRDTGRDILMVAGSTGLAPLKAITAQIAGSARRPQVSLHFAARHPDGLYDLPALEKMEAQHDWLTVTTGLIASGADWRNRDCYVAGPSDMVASVKEELMTGGVPGEQVFAEDFGWKEPEP